MKKIHDRIIGRLAQGRAALPGGRRSGTILVLVVAILTVLMLMATTAAMTTRVGLFTGSYYSDSARTEALSGSVEKRVRHILHTDKYGLDQRLGTPPGSYDYDVLEAAGVDPSTIAPDRSYPERTDFTLDSDDENFDSPLTEEWLPNPTDPSANDAWRRFNNANNNAALVDTNGDGRVNHNDTPYALWKPMHRPTPAGVEFDYGSLLGGGVKARYALYMIDMGGGRADLNALGNARGDRNQGLGPYEAELGELIDNLGGDTTDEQAIAEWRYGPNATPDIDTGQVFSNDPNMDINLDGQVETSYQAGIPAEFIAEFPGGDDTPFGAYSMHDLFWGSSRGSPAARLLAEDAGIAPGDLRLFTTRSGNTIVAGRSVLNTSTWGSTRPSDLRGANFFTFSTGAFPESPTGGNLVQLPLKRAMWSDSISSVHGETSETVAGDIEQFIRELGGPEGYQGGGTLPAAASDDLSAQIAHNLVDLVDRGHEITRDGAGNYYGVERMPYIAEVEASIDTLTGNSLADSSGFVPDPDTDGHLPDPAGSRIRWGETYYADGELTGSADGIYQDGEAVWMENQPGTSPAYDPGVDVPIVNCPPGGPYAPTELGTDEPQTGWGKYIKLVNPWPTDLNLGNYSLRVENLRRWDFDQTNGEWEVDTASGPVTINLSGTIPARGHLIIVDYASPGGDYQTPFQSIPSGSLVQETRINGMQEGEGPDAMTPTQITLRKGGTTVMEFRLTDTGGASLTDEDDDDDPTGDDNGNRDTVQVNDPRPCRVRNGDHITSSDYLWLAEEEVRTMDEWPASAGECAELGWFNRTWRGPAAATVGDGWELLRQTNNTDTPNMNRPNILHSFVPAQPVDSAVYTGVTTGQETLIRNSGKLPTVGALGYVHAGVPWTSLSLSEPPSTGAFNEESLVVVPGLMDYLVGPTSPYRDAFDQDGEQDDAGDADLDGELDNASGPDRNGAEIRRSGQVNVNTAPSQVIAATLKRDIISGAYGGAPSAQTIANAIVTERQANGPYTSLSDLFNRVPEIFSAANTISIGGGNVGNGFAREALARFMSNLVTVRTDVWGVIGRVQIFDDWQDDPANGTVGVYDPQYDVVPPDAVVAERRFYFVLDRSHEPARVIMKRYLPE
ncbi:MAG: hypothetical protein V5A84_01775 [Planctomycetota bacterium]